MPRKKAVTLRDPADRLGLGVYTVSKTLRGLPGMSEATRRLVFATAREMNYATKAQEAGLAAESIAYAAGKPRRFVMLMPAEFM
ncbi:LacI family DNA-binding transcriptional regulator [Paenibacillus sp. S150]|uniref:LacI family DNA-binding transcriptional regulator n=1 Tax=Paenibacillus sp. S150 TaxID=2749826 RepID=UPI001C576A78|nr:LacI family DNA-binding transcriptional regulator [Paenibacillus sp. S150]MBW4079843.1 LacI family DNA-binding transcriptional regulator [Paenibacillus sp. S150]